MAHFVNRRYPTRLKALIGAKEGDVVCEVEVLRCKFIVAERDRSTTGRKRGAFLAAASALLFCTASLASDRNFKRLSLWNAQEERPTPTLSRRQAAVLDAKA